MLLRRCIGTPACPLYSSAPLLWWALTGLVPKMTGTSDCADGDQGETASSDCKLRTALELKRAEAHGMPVVRKTWLLLLSTLRSRDMCCARIASYLMNQLPRSQYYEDIASGTSFVIRRSAPQPTGARLVLLPASYSTLFSAMNRFVLAWLSVS